MQQSGTVGNEQWGWLGRHVGRRHGWLNTADHAVTLSVRRARTMAARVASSSD